VNYSTSPCHHVNFHLHSFLGEQPPTPFMVFICLVYLLVFHTLCLYSPLQCYAMSMLPFALLCCIERNREE
jgi:hypothetical protein